MKNHTSSTLLSRQHRKNAYMIFTNSLKSKTWSTLHQISPTIMAYPRHSGNKTKSGPQLVQWLPMPLAQLTRHSINFFRNPTPMTQISDLPWNLYTKLVSSYASFATTSQSYAVKHFTETRNSFLPQLLKDVPWWSHLKFWREPNSQTKSIRQPIRIVAEEYVGVTTQTLIDSATATRTAVSVTTATTAITPSATIVIRPTSQATKLTVAATPLFGVPLLNTMQGERQPSNDSSGRETATVQSSMEQTLQRRLDSQHYHQRLRHSIRHFATNKTSASRPTATQAIQRNNSNRTRNHGPLIQESNRGSNRRRIYQPHFYHTQKNRRSKTCPQPPTTQPTHHTTSLQDGINKDGVQHHQQEGLPNKHRPPGCFSSHPDSPLLTKISSVPLEGETISIPSSTLWALLGALCLHENSQANSQVGTSQGNSDFSIPGRPADCSQDRTTLQATHTDGHGQAQGDGILSQAQQITPGSNTEITAPRIQYQHQGYDALSTQGQGARPMTRGNQDHEQGNSDHSRPVILHWESTSHDSSNPPSQAQDSEPSVAQESGTQDPQYMDGIYFSDNAGKGGSTVVDRVSSSMEWSNMDSTTTSRGGIYRRLRPRMGHHSQQHNNLRKMAPKRSRPTHQLEGATGSLACDQPSTTTGQTDNGVLRQHNHHCIHQQIRGHTIRTAHASGRKNLEFLPSDRNESEHCICPISVQPSRSAELPTQQSTRMEHQSASIRGTRQEVGPTSDRSLCHTPEHQTTNIHVMEV